MKKIVLGELYQSKGESVNPSQFPDETFEYYSIPAYDTGVPEITKGKEIGSSKKLFQSDDVLLSRIVPHIRRCWIVEKGNGLRQIGSGEWITFRSKEVVPSYLRYYLLSNDFNAKFLKTIKGVGGSLMRADPKQVARFEFLLPPLNQQKKIAAILDAADTYRQKTKALIEKYDQLTQSLFLDMFGDPVSNPKGWDIKTFNEVLGIRNGKNQKKVENPSGKYPIYGS
ncbi:MAG: restriction endonuclease subunit S, partial [Ignavibacteriae bacterium]|nr:restriction endonuclease subunit S [Ignavibacteriota bacterium]